jgi:predicted secreted Zn-dependent protease
MQNLRISFLSIALSFPLFFHAQDKKDGLIGWNVAKRLTWNDYKAKPDPNSDAAATTTTYLGIQYDFKNNKISYKIECSFSKNKSWGLYKTDYILSHEQGHFDITEIFARQLNKRMSEYVFDKNTYQKDLQKIYNDIQQEKEVLQDQYDDETDHSRLKEKQEEWLKKIAAMLAEFEAFSEY